MNGQRSFGGSLTKVALLSTNIYYDIEYVSTLIQYLHMLAYAHKCVLNVEFVFSETFVADGNICFILTRGL